MSGKHCYCPTTYKNKSTYLQSFVLPVHNRTLDLVSQLKKEVIIGAVFKKQEYMCPICFGLYPTRLPQISGEIRLENDDFVLFLWVASHWNVLKSEILLCHFQELFKAFLLHTWEWWGFKGAKNQLKLTVTEFLFCSPLISLPISHSPEEC